MGITKSFEEECMKCEFSTKGVEDDKANLSMIMHKLSADSWNEIRNLDEVKGMMLKDKIADEEFPES